MPKFNPGVEMFVDTADFIRQHDALDVKVHNHRLRLDKRLSEGALSMAARGREKDLFADNFDARNAFVRIAVEQVRCWVDGASSDIDLHTVVIMPKKFVIPADQALSYDIEPLKRFVRRAMRGHDYVAMVEFAYYRRWPDGKPTVSPHVHLIDLGAKRPRLDACLAQIWMKHASIIPGWNSAGCRSINRDQLESKLLYMMKFPMRAYEPFCRVRTDWNTGEVKDVVEQHKPDLRPGELVKMTDILASHHLDRMLFGGGAGRAVCKKVALTALGPLRRDEALRKIAAAYRKSPTTGIPRLL